jgi:deoxycytidylate deaminase
MRARSHGATQPLVQTDVHGTGDGRHANGNRKDRDDAFGSGVSVLVSSPRGCPDPFRTPTSAEHAMSLAFAGSLRSADLSRQVGAVVVSQAGEVIATGANDVPRYCGGLYWPGSDGQRDYIRGNDSNKVEIEKIVQDILQKSQDRPTPPSGSELEKALRASRLRDLTEFGRAVHAEMEALLARWFFKGPQDQGNSSGGRPLRKQ